MSISFGASTNATETDSQTPYLNAPYLGMANLEVVKKEEYSEGTLPVLIFTFRTLGENEISNFEMDGERLHDHTEFPFDEEDLEAAPDEDAAPAQKKIDRIAWILSYFMSQEQAEQAVQVNGARDAEHAWEMLRDQVVTAFREHADTEKNVRIKIKAEVYNGSDQVSTPYYKGWIQDEESDHELSWTRGDGQDAREWQRAQDASPSENGSMPAGGDGASGGEDWDW